MVRWSWSWSLRLWRTSLPRITLVALHLHLSFSDKYAVWPWLPGWLFSVEGRRGLVYSDQPLASSSCHALTIPCRTSVQTEAVKGCLQQQPLVATGSSVFHTSSRSGQDKRKVRLEEKNDSIKQPNAKATN